MRLFHPLLLLPIFISSFQLFGNEKECCKEGNFSLPFSQQPGPLLGFGRNIIIKDQVQLTLFGEALVGKNKHFIDLAPAILYGITDELTVYFAVPIAADQRVDKAHSSGFGDLELQLEYGVFSRKCTCESEFSDLVTLSAGISFPTGSTHKNPPTGLGAMGYFLGATYAYTGIRWHWYTSYGIEAASSHDGTRFGNEYLYQIGVGRNLLTKNGWIYILQVEVDGTFSNRDEIKGKMDPNSGGNVVFATPSVWISSKDWIYQLGLGFPIQQNLFGDQKRYQWLLAFNIQRAF